MVERRGSKLILRDFRHSDIAEFTRWQKPGHLWQRLNDPADISSEDFTAPLIANLRAEIDRAHFPRPRARMAIASFDDVLIGTVSCYWDSQESECLCLGITLYDPALWRHGLGECALRLWVTYIFEVHPDLVRLDLRTWSGNPGMMALAEKLGFVREACFRKARVVGGEYFDGLGYGLLREEWASG